MLGKTIWRILPHVAPGFSLPAVLRTLLGETYATPPQTCRSEERRYITLAIVQVANPWNAAPGTACCAPTRRSRKFTIAPRCVIRDTIITRGAEFPPWIDILYTIHDLHYFSNSRTNLIVILELRLNFCNRESR
jgi:hypothetical protein